MRVEQVRGAVQPDGRLAGAGRPLDAHRLAQRRRTMSSWSGWMVATMSRIGPLRGRSISARSNRHRRGASPAPQALVLVPGQLAAGEPEPATAGQTLGIGGAGPVDRPAHGGPPVDDDRVPGVVPDVPAADVEGLLRAVGAHGVGAPEERRDTRIGGQRPQPLGPRRAEPLGGPGIHPRVHDSGGGGPHPGQAVGRLRQVRTLGGEDGIGNVSSRGHGRPPDDTAATRRPRPALMQPETTSAINTGGALHEPLRRACAETLRAPLGTTGALQLLARAVR